MIPVIRDSEDEDEEEFFVPEDHVVSKPSQQSSNSWMINTVDEILAEFPSQKSEGADQSSLSTGNLQRQIADASRGLFDSTSDQATMKEHSLDSSATLGDKKARRHSALVGSGSSAKATKRTKTTNVTYGSSKNTPGNDSAHFDALRDEALPGALQTDFVNHEPTVMFRDTGSTIADNESSQQRMVEQTIKQGKQLSNVTEQKCVDSGKPESSPFPWPESSVPTQAPGGTTSMRSQPESVLANGMVLPRLSRGSQKDATADKEANISPDTTKPSPPPVADHVLTDPSVSRKQSPPPHWTEAAQSAEDQSHSNEAQQHQHSSPQVSVPRVRVKSNTQTSAHPVEAPKGRKRKFSTTANLEPLNSDDRAIGHPKEMYQPRLSRRRATGLIEQPQDFSIIPEKAAKRRRKTTSTASAAPELAEDELALDPSTASQMKAVLKSEGSGDAASPCRRSATTSTIPMMTKRHPPDRGEVRALLKDLDFPLTNTPFDAGGKEKSSPTKHTSSLSARKISAAAIVAMPPPTSPVLLISPKKRLSKAATASAMPPPSSSATRTSRRSHTTIFEDHIDFGASQERSPSLQQQQADRKLAVLKEVKNVSTQAMERKRRSIVQDEDEDEDGEDELVKDQVAEAPVPRKRGRPAKAPVAKSAEHPPPTDRVLPDSDAEPDEEFIVEPAKKRGRTGKAPAAKPAKSAERVLEDSEDDFTEHHSEDDEPPKKKDRTSKVTVTSTNNTPAPAVGPKPSSRRASAGSMSWATPPPDGQSLSSTKQHAAGKATSPAMPAPAAHTPIKTSSKVIHRVGLNRRQRVQPLLKMVRPPAPRPAAPAKKR